MYIKSTLLAAAAAAIATSASASETVGQNQISAHRQFKVQDKICVSKQPITTCKHGFQPIYEHNSQRFVEMYCLDEQHPLADQMQQVMETGHRLRSLQQEAQKRQMPVPKVTRCHTPRLTRDGEVEDDSQQRNGQRFSKSNRAKFANNRQQYQAIRSEQQAKLQQLKKLMPTIEKAVQLSDSQYQEAYQLIKMIAHQDEKIEGGLYMLSQYLPQAYVEATQRIQNELVEDDMSESEKQEVQEQLKKLAKRVYVFALTRLVQEQQKQPINEQVEENNYTNWEQFEGQFQRLWSYIKRDMNTENQSSIGEQVEQQVQRQFKQQIKTEEQKQLKAWQLALQQNQQDDESFNKQQAEQDENQPKNWDEEMTQEQRERQQLQLTKIILAGLKTAQEMQKEQQQYATGAFSGLFSQKSNYGQLTKQVKKQFQNTNF